MSNNLPCYSLSSRKKMEKVNILWFRNGLRLHDNFSLHKAVKQGKVSENIEYRLYSVKQGKVSENIEYRLYIRVE